MDYNNVSDAAILIAERLIASGVIILSKDILGTVLKKIIRKFK
jgi:hypothetical protein